MNGKRLVLAGMSPAQDLSIVRGSVLLQLSSIEQRLRSLRLQGLQVIIN
jgi:hypothetical protein